MGVDKSTKFSSFVIYSHLKENVITALKRDAKFSTRYVKRVPFVNRGYTKGVPFRLKMVFKRGKR